MQIRDLLPWSHKQAEIARREDDNPVAALQRDINRIFDGFWQQFDQPFRSVDRALGLAGPRAEVAETEDKVEVSMELQPIGGASRRRSGPKI